MVHAMERKKMHDTVSPNLGDPVPENVDSDIPPVPENDSDALKTTGRRSSISFNLPVKSAEVEDSRTEAATETTDQGYSVLNGQDKAKLSSEPASAVPLPAFRHTQGILSSSEFQDLIESVKEAIQEGVQPIRIRQGSSGSYFVRNKIGRIVGVFKPKNEEPYGHLNPKWTKWLHKTCLPCFFGRSCLIPNTGYVSEAAASVLDRRLSLDLVPHTEIVELSSPAFHYSWLDRRQSRSKNTPLPMKIGSFQIFLTGYRDAALEVRDFLDPSLSPENLNNQFRQSFERLVILDYLMRNTDRGMDNWMIFYGRVEEESGDLKSKSELDMVASPSQEQAGSSDNLRLSQREPIPAHRRRNSVASENSWTLVSSPVVRIAAIDNGLAFPFKHPDQWRSYPYGWSWLQCTKVPFSEATIRLYLPKLKDAKWIEETILELKQQFSRDEDFDPKTFHQQMDLFRGQCHNLVETLEEGSCPFELIRKPLLLISEEQEGGGSSIGPGQSGLGSSSSISVSGGHGGDDESGSSASLGRRPSIKKKLKKMMIHVKPCFTWC